jgi:hypothetical protein
VLSVVLATVAYHLGAVLWLLIITGLVIGCVDAFYLPASGSMPRRLVSTEQLPRALALRQIGAQVISMGGGPLGGVLVGLAGLAGAATVDAVTFGLVMVVLLMIRPTHDVSTAPADKRHLLRDAAAGVRLGFEDPVLRPGLLLIGAAAGFLLPIMPLLLPLLARDQHWGAGAAGVVVGAQAVGMVAVTLGIVRRGPLGRPGLLAAVGLMLAGLGVLGLAFAPGVAAAVGAGFVIGLGNGLFSSHIGPLIMTVTPGTHLSRMQALLTLVQSLPLLFMNNVLGNLAGLSGITVAVAVSACAVGGTGLLALTSRPLRTTRTGLDPV